MMNGRAVARGGVVRLAVVLVLACAAWAEDIEFKVHGGTVVIKGLAVTVGRITKLPAFGSVPPGAIGSVDITVTVLNRSGEDWKGLPLDIDVYDEDGSLVGAPKRKHSFRVPVSVKNGDESTVRVNRGFEGGAKGLRPSRVTASVASEMETARLAQSPAAVGFLGSDSKCAQDFRDALTLGGLEQRKRLAELLQYRCGIVFDSPVHVVPAETVGDFISVLIIEGSSSGKSGWIPVAWLKPWQM